MGKQVTLTNLEILNAMGSIKSLMQIEDKDFSVKAKWNLMKNMKRFEATYKTFTEMEYDYVNQYAIKDENGEFILDDNKEPKFAPNNKKEYLLKRDELLNLENEIDILTVNLSDLEGHVTNGNILYFLEFMIDED